MSNPAEHMGRRGTEQSRPAVSFTSELPTGLPLLNAVDLKRIWPALANPAPPVPLERKDGQFRFNVAEEFAQLSARVERNEFRLRAPAESTTGLVGPIQGVGDCLAPVLTADTYWFDPCEPAQDGDLVLVKFDEQWFADWVESLNGHPAYESMYGGLEARVPNMGIKLLTFHIGTPMLVARNDRGEIYATPLAGGRVLGVVVGVLEGPELDKAIAAAREGTR